MSKEIGWNPLYDEGVRLLAESSGFSGIRVNLQTPTEYDCPSPQSYFNFYLGFNENAGKNPGRQIETGISYSAQGWQGFINNSGKETASAKLKVEKGALIRLELTIVGKNVRLMIGTTPLSSPFSLSAGAPKMIIALAESHRNLKDRKTWFDKAAMTCTEIRIGNQWQCPTSDKIAFETKKIDQKLIISTTTAYSVSAVMNKPS